MALPAGRFDKRVTILRRPAQNGPAGQARGEFAAVTDLTRIPAAVLQQRGARLIEAGFPSEGVQMIVTLRATHAARTITGADRLRLLGETRDYAIDNVLGADRREIELHCRRVEGA